MGIFNSIKKSRRASSDIDEKIEYLNKELEKTGLREAMSTSNIYVGGQSVDNPIYTSFNNATFNGLSLGHSGADGVGSGGAYTGKMIPSEVGLTPGYHDSILNTPKAALSPPHPVSGKRRYASTRLGGMIGQQFFPTQPGVIQGNRTLPTGSVAWLWNPNINNTDGTTGNWYPLEFEPHNGLWGFWDTNFMGFAFLNLNLDQLEFASGDNTGSTVVSLFSSIGISNKNNVGTEKTIVLQKNDLDDPSFIPINIDGLSTQGFNYLKDKAKTTASSGVNYDLSNWINKTYGGAASNWYENNPSLPHESNPHIPAVEAPYVPLASADGVKIASTDPSAAFASAPSPDIPTDTDQGEGSKPSKAKGTDAKLGKWMSRTDFMALYPNSTMSEYLDALPYGGTNFMKPDPNFPNARIVDTDAYEKYFMTGNTSGLSDSKPKHKETPEVEYTPQELKKGFSVNQTLNYLKTKFKSPLGPATDIMADIVANTFGQRGSKAVLDDYMRNFIPDLFSGKNVAGKTSANPRNVGNMYSNKALNDFEKVFAKYQSEQEQLGNPNISDNLKRLLKDPTTNWKSEFHATSAANSEIGNTYGQFGSDVDGVDDFVDNGDGTVTLTKRYDFDDMADLAGSDPASTLGAYSYGIISGIPGLLGKGEGGKTPSSYLGITFDKKTGKVIKNYKKGIAESLDESIKLGHFEPEQLNVDIEQLRKGIMPEFPKDPPPKLINGYSEKSKLAPKELERSSFIKITKKDLAKNHRLKDSEIKDFMDTINAVNEFIKKHPEELIYAQTRYPKNDPRLAQLNWEMDQKLNASKEYMDKHYPENQKLFTKIQKSIKKNIELTDPKSFKGVKVPKFKGVDLTDFKRRKEVVARHYKKAVKTKKLFSRKKT